MATTRKSKKSYCLSIFILLSVFCNAQNHWAQRIWGIGFDIGFGVTSDSQGNVYSAGIYNGDGHFGNIIIPNPASAYEAYVTKYNEEGVAQWANHGSGLGVSESHAVFVDAQQNVYITGYFDSVTTFGSTTLITDGMLDIFVAKLDSSGNFLWAISAGGPGADNGKSISVDVSGNVFVTGSFSNQCNFGGTTLTSYGENDAFLAKYNNSGILLWVRSGGSNSDPSGNDYGTGVVNDLSGNAYISGYFIDTAYFDMDTLVSFGSYDPFIAKYNSLGTIQWIQHGGGGSGDGAKGIAIDQMGNLHLTGSVYTDIPVQFGGSVINGGGGDDIFHVVYDTAGTVISAFVDGGSKDQVANAIAVDPFGNVYITGDFLDSANFSGQDYIGKGAYDAFVVMYDATGTLIKSRQYGAENYDVGYGITADVMGNCISTGYFHFNTQFGNTSLTGGGNADVYLMTLNDSLESANGLVVTNFHTGNSSLRSNNISDIIVDRNNEVYVATVDSGVFKFNGILWQNINCPSDKINSLFSDSINNIWISTPDSGLIKYNGSSFVSFNTGNSGIGTNNITCTTSLPGGALWIGTKGNGCIKYNGITYTVFDMSNSILPDNNITTMNCDSAGRIWMGTEAGGLVSFFNSVFTVYDFNNSGIPSNRINGACVDNLNNKIWAATDSGLASFDGSTWTVINEASGFPGNEINDIFITQSGDQNSATRKKGTVVNSGTVQRNANTRNALFDNNVKTVYTDTTGNVIWLGTQFNGVYMLIDTTTVAGLMPEINYSNSFNVSYYPNPTSDEIILSYTLQNKSAVKITVSDINGKEYKIISFKDQSPGAHTEQFSFRQYIDGVYFIKLFADDGTSVSRILKTREKQ